MADTTAIAKGAVSILIEVLALTFQVSIAVLTTRKMRKMDRKHKVDIKLKLLFGSTVFAAFCTTILCLVASTTIMIHGDYPHIVVKIFFVTTFYFFISLLATLVLRLYITFQKSIFKMSKRKYSDFVVIFVILFISSVIATVLFDGDESTRSDLMMTLGIACFGTFWILFFIGSFLAVKYFVGNLNKLARARVDAMSAAGIDKDEIALDEVCFHEMCYIIYFFV